MSSENAPKKPWNKGKLVGGKTPLKPDEVQAIRVVLSQAGWPPRDALMFAVAVDSSLRGHDLVRLRVADLMLTGKVRGQIVVEPSKTRDSSSARVSFELRPDTHELLERFVELEHLLETDFLFTSTRQPKSKPRQHLTERAYAKLVHRWIASIGLSPEQYGTHSIRKVRAAYLYQQTGNIRACQVILGHKSIVTTQRYLGVEENEAMALSRQFAV